MIIAGFTILVCFILTLGSFTIASMVLRRRRLKESCDHARRGDFVHAEMIIPHEIF